MRKIALCLIRGYQYILSPWIGQHCRFWPTCSSYTHDAILLHGLLKGLALGVKRVLRCNPWHCGGIDPVPENKKTF